MKKLSEKDKTLHAQFSQYGRNAREWMRKCVLLLPEIERNRVWEKKGFCSIYEYAAKLAGMSHETVNESLRVLKKIEDKPELMKVVEEKGYRSVRPVLSVTTAENAKFWAEKINNMSINTLETYVREYKKINDENGRHMTAKTFGFPQQEAITILVEPQIAEQLRKLKGEGDWNEIMKEFLKLREEKLASELKEIEQKQIKKFIKKNTKNYENENVDLNEETKIPKTTISEKELYKAKSRPVSTKIKKYVLHKTNHTCAFPGCTKPAEQLHHTERFGITGRHNPDKIIPLCKEHHELAHNGLIENEDLSPNEWRIGKKADMTDYKILVDQRVAEFRRV